jgi:Na+-translocating ferredoxin:NAD+ oxidoreductase RnfD subunit
MKKELSVKSASDELVVEPAPHVTGPMTKNRLMQYTFVALVIIEVISAVLLWSVNESGWSLGITAVVDAVIAVVVAVALDGLLSLIMKKRGALNTMSAAVFGMIVALSYTLGIPSLATVEVLPLNAPQAFYYVAIISAVGLIVFKKLQGLLGRKYVNPAAAAKLVVMLPFINTILVAVDHLKSGPEGVPSLAGPIGYTVIGKNGMAPFSLYIQACFSQPSVKTPPSFKLGCHNSRAGIFHCCPKIR